MKVRNTARLLKIYPITTHRFELLGGYNYVGDTEKILLGLGFKREVFNNQTETFSGGWRMRIELAKLLLQANDILLLMSQPITWILKVLFGLKVFYEIILELW
jgi:ATPase subunit of ABC transporter with duplicated ATPase domains